MRRASKIVMASLLAAAVSVPLLAGEETGQMPPEMMKAMMPGEHHEHIQMLAGEYTLKGQAWMEPGAPPTEFTGTRTAKMILGGRFLEERVESTFTGTPFVGKGLLGYDNLSDRYIYTWVDDMSTAVTTSTGGCSKEGWVLEGEHKDPMTGEMIQFKNVIKRDDDGTIVFEWYEGDARTMEIRYVPKSKS